MRGYYFITDPKLSRAGIFSDAEKAVSAGVRVVQYRNKEACTRQMVEEAKELRRICKKILFLVNDRVDVCLASGADGVHLGQDDMDPVQARKILGDGMVVGVTVHTVEEAVRAQHSGALYLGVSPIFPTRTKRDAGKATGIGLIREIKRHTHLPVVAVGGIKFINAASVIEAGADCLCAISAVVTAEDVKAEIGKFQALYGIRHKRS